MDTDLLNEKGMKMVEISESKIKNRKSKRHRFKGAACKVAAAALLSACSTVVVNTPLQSTANAAPASEKSVALEKSHGASSSSVANSEVRSERAKTYEVGPSSALKTPNEVPWETLKPGDTVLIHWRAEPYRNKFVIAVEGTEQAPITIRGVEGPNGELPVIDGENATTSKHCDFWGEARGVVKIGGARNANKIGSKWIVLENLDITRGRQNNTYTNGKGVAEKYARNGAALWVEHAEHLVVRNCALHNAGNGLVVSSNDKYVAEDILIEGCHIYDNGEADGYEHNSYTEAKGIVFQYNWFGKVRKGAAANNLKDRSCGCVIRYNWFDGGDKVLDLVEAEDSKPIREDPRYRQTFVYGNILVKDNSYHPQVVHYGGDSGKASMYRKGTLYFYNNTVVSKKKQGTHIFWLPTDDETCDARNNIFYTEGTGKSLALLTNKGILQLSHNYLKPGFRKTSQGKDMLVRDDNTSVLAESPGFVDEEGGDFHLKAGSPCRGAATKLAPAALPVERDYKKHQGGVAKAANEKEDLGAY